MSTSPPKVRTVEIGPDASGQRIDNYLTRELKGVPKSLIYRVLRKGEVRVNKGRVQPGYKLQDGDVLRIPPVRVSEGEHTAAPSESIKELIKQSILYEDNGLLVINKPSGVAVHGGSGIQYGVIEALRALYPQKKDLELVHRLDRDTSGCLMVAKKRSVLRHLHDQIRDKTVEKYYLALLRGGLAARHLNVNAPLQKNTLKSGERVVRVHTEGKPSVSVFDTVETYGVATLARVQAVTGRTHQIRVHAAHINHPVAGDEKYGDEVFNRSMRELGLKRLFLHAHTLRLTAPDTGKPLELTAPLADALQDVLKVLARNTGNVHV